MSIITKALFPLLNNKIVFSGMAAGFAAGSAVSIWNNRSILKRNPNYDDFITRNTGAINEFRENGGKELTNCLSPGTSSVLRNAMLFIIMMKVVSSCKQVGAWNSAKAWNIVKTGLKQIGSSVSLPAAMSIAAVVGGFSCREKINAVVPQPSYANSSYLDVSGHAIIHTAFLINMALVMQSVKSIGTLNQQRAFTVLVAGIAVTDAVWTYHTVAKHHAVADVVVGASCTVLAFLALQLLKSGVVKSIEKLTPKFKELTNTVVATWTKKIKQ